MIVLGYILKKQIFNLMYIFLFKDMKKCLITSEKLYEIKKQKISYKLEKNNTKYVFIKKYFRFQYYQKKCFLFYYRHVFHYK